MKRIAPADVFALLYQDAPLALFTEKGTKARSRLQTSPASQ